MTSSRGTVNRWKKTSTPNRYDVSFTSLRHRFVCKSYHLCKIRRNHAGIHPSFHQPFLPEPQCLLWMPAMSRGLGNASQLCPGNNII